MRDSGGANPTEKSVDETRRRTGQAELLRGMVRPEQMAARAETRGSAARKDFRDAIRGCKKNK